MNNPFDFAADYLDPPSDTWQPLPHQIPPPGRWFVWLLLGGRGAGKTAAAARHMHNHVMGPPCLPNVPGGHWPAIIAPTLGDGVTSCVNGPSGLRSHCPEAKVRVTPGGTVVKWPNGCEAKLFGAHTPEDVERLRSGGNRCFVGSTKMLTDRGWVRMDQVTTHDLAWTRFGWRPMDRAGLVDPAAEVWELHLSDGGVIHVTPDHKFLTQEGLEVELRHLKVGTRLAAWQTDEHALTDLTFHSERPSSWTEEPSLPMQRATTSADLSGCTSTSSNARVSRFRRVMRFITSIISRGTIESRISKFSPSQPTPAFTPRQRGSRLSKRPSHARIVAMSSLPFVQPKFAVEDAMTSGEKRPSRGLGTQTSSVSTAGRISVAALDLEYQLATARCSAVIEPMPGKVVASQQVKSLKIPSGKPSSAYGVEVPQDASVSVARIVRTNRQEPVYCVRVPGVHEFAVKSHSTKIGVKNCMVWAEELAAWRYMEDCWQHMRYGLRVGPRPHVVVSTTPKPRMLLKQLIKQDNVAITTASTAENPYLDSEVKKALFEDYGGTRLGQQELYAKILDDIEGALWTAEGIAQDRIGVATIPEYFDRIVVGVDPAVGPGTTGILVCGVLGPYRWLAPNAYNSELSHGFVLGDYSIQGSPNQWAKQVYRAYADWEADVIVAEINNGGELVVTNIRTVDSSLPVQKVTASRGKIKRAEPIAALYEQHRIHHVGHDDQFMELEDQMVTYDHQDPDPAISPDRMDAMVWAFHKLMVERSTLRMMQLQDDRLKGRR